ncbi:phage terminase large subunit-like protein [Elusimicrobium simillimum]|uniref:hypothetical protein n=1 Tax=Elusimicrobium simillimum TaxID=3143438 RepID=UPI003C6FBF04
MEAVSNYDMVEQYAVPFIERANFYGFRGAYIEDKGHGIYLNQKLPKLGVPMPGPEEIAEFFKDRRTDKVQRLNAVMPFLAYNKVIINEEIDEELVNECISEALNFPKGNMMIL